MPASTRTALPHAQWRLMNVLDGSVRHVAKTVMHRCNLGADDLLSLWERELIAASLDGAEVDFGMLSLDLRVLTQFDIRLHLTPAGVRWVAENPSNRALLAVDDLDSGRGALLKDVAAKADVDPPAFLVLATVRLVQVQFPDGHEVRYDDTSALRLFKDLRVKLLAAGRELVRS